MEIVCPHCQTINRVPADRLQDGPVCAACKQALLPATPVVLSDESFANYVSRTELPVIVDFWAPWCGPCRSMAPWFAEAAKQLHGRAVLAKLDTEAYQASAAQHHIRSIPTLVIFKGGKEVAREAGARPAGEIVRWVEQYLS